MLTPALATSTVVAPTALMTNRPLLAALDAPETRNSLPTADDGTLKALVMRIWPAAGELSVPPAAPMQICAEQTCDSWSAEHTNTPALKQAEAAGKPLLQVDAECGVLHALPSEPGLLTWTPG